MRSQRHLHSATYIICVVLAYCMDGGSIAWKNDTFNFVANDNIVAFLKIDPAANEYDEYYQENTLNEKQYNKVDYDNVPNKDSTDRWNFNSSYLEAFDSKLKNHNLTKKIKSQKENNYFIDNDLDKYHAKNLNTEIDVFKWPTFEEMLFSIGKKYDWKNDRWLKVRRKEMKTQMTNVHNDIPIKHYFRYRRVKLNTIKTKRNIVIAVSAIR